MSNCLKSYVTAHIFRECFTSFYFQAVVNSTTTEDGEATHLDAELSTIIPVLEDTSSTPTLIYDDCMPILEDSTVITLQSSFYEEPPLLQSYLEITTPAYESDSSMADELMDMVRRSNDE